MKKNVLTIILAFLFPFFLAANTNDIVPQQKLKDFLPETLGGMPKYGEIEGKTQETEDGKKLSMVTQNYASGDQSGSIIIVTSNVIVPKFEMLNMTINVQVDDDEQYWNLTTVKGFKVFEQYYKKTRKAKIFVLYNDGNAVEISMSNTENTKPLIQCAESMDLEGLASLIK